MLKTTQTAKQLQKKQIKLASASTLLASVSRHGNVNRKACHASWLSQQWGEMVKQNTHVYIKTEQKLRNVQEKLNMSFLFLSTCVWFSLDFHVYNHFLNGLRKFVFEVLSTISGILFSFLFKDFLRQSKKMLSKPLKFLRKYYTPPVIRKAVTRNRDT